MDPLPAAFAHAYEVIRALRGQWRGTLHPIVRPNLLRLCRVYAFATDASRIPGVVERKHELARILGKHCVAISSSFDSIQTPAGVDDAPLRAGYKAAVLVAATCLLPLFANDDDVRPALTELYAAACAWDPVAVADLGAIVDVSMV